MYDWVLSLLDMISLTDRLSLHRKKQKRQISGQHIESDPLILTFNCKSIAFDLQFDALLTAKISEEYESIYLFLVKKTREKKASTFDFSTRCN